MTLQGHNELTWMKWLIFCQWQFPMHFYEWNLWYYMLINISLKFIFNNPTGNTKPSHYQCQLDSWEPISVKLETQYTKYLKRKCVWKCYLQKSAILFRTQYIKPSVTAETRIFQVRSLSWLLASCRADSRHVLSQWETSLQSNTVSLIGWAQT